METAASIAVTLLGVVVVFQIALAFGAPWGAAAWGGRYPGVLPTGAVMNLVSRSRPERWWAPVSLGVAICCAVIARGL